jgi:hypothetical protein
MVRGNYDVAINKSVAKLKKSQRNGDEILLIDKAYKIANEQDSERIRFLEMENNPGNWEEITNLYGRLIARQSVVRTVTPYTYKGVKYEYVYNDYDKVLIEAKRKAAEFLFIRGKKEMEKGTKDGMRKAWENFTKTEELSGGSYDVDGLILESRALGMTNVLLQVVNDTHLKLSPDFMENILMFDKSGLNSFWVNYYAQHLDDKIKYDYVVNVVLKDIVVSPNETRESDRFEEREVEDGWEYVLDKNDNVKKDSSGNDIKVKRYKMLKCSVVETFQFKDCVIGGIIEYLSENPYTLIEQVPASVQVGFEHSSARAIGDWDALSDKSKKMCNVEPVPFPIDEEMVYFGADKLKKEIRRVLYNHKRNIY